MKKDCFFQAKKICKPNHFLQTAAILLFISMCIRTSAQSDDTIVKPIRNKNSVGLEYFITPGVYSLSHCLGLTLQMRKITLGFGPTIPTFNRKTYIITKPLIGGFLSLDYILNRINNQPNFTVSFMSNYLNYTIEESGFSHSHRSAITVRNNYTEVSAALGPGINVRMFKKLTFKASIMANFYYYYFSRWETRLPNQPTQKGTESFGEFYVYLYKLEGVFARVGLHYTF